MVSNLNEFIRKFPHIQLHDLTVWFPSDDKAQLPDMAPYVRSYSNTLRTLKIFRASRSTSTADLISAVCECKSLSRFGSFEHPIHTAHVLQVLNSCPLLVDLSICESGNNAIALGDILWFTRSGSALKSLALASDYDARETLVDGGDDILQHLQRLMANHPSDCWDTVRVGGFFTKCRRENSLHLTFSDSNARVLLDNKDEIVSAIQSHAFAMELTFADTATSIPAFEALADFHEALNKPINVDLFINLSALNNLNRTFHMISGLHIETEFGMSIDDAALVLMVKSFPHIAEINLDWNYMADQITDRGMCVLFAGCPQLKCVTLGEVPRVTKRSLHAILANNLHLHLLKIQQSAITPKDIVKFRKLAVQQQFLPIPVITVEASRKLWLTALLNGGR